ncbi:MAG TPA: penicillin-binding transpeptidase domain-containing protein [Bacillales bacterium]|nr:penicillin-binding transpeptidase domain-containing protein [Bacillales bacterium]
MNSRKNTNINKGAAVLLIVFLLLFFALIARFGYVGLTKTAEGRELMNLAVPKWTEEDQLKAERGTIYDSNGNPLAKDVPAFTVTAVLSEKMKGHYVKNPEKTAEALAPILNMEESKLVDLLTRDAFQVELGPGGRRISYEKKEQIKKLDLPGIGFIRQSKRYYPNQKFASYVLGFTTRDPETGELKGVMGIEESKNKKLTGKDGSVKYMTTPGGVQLPGTKKVEKPAKNGNNVYLTIDNHIQTFLEHAITKANKEYDPKRIMAVVMDPDTGAILAMANRPSFNPNNREIDDYTNDIVSVPFEPGSVMKIFTLAAAVDAGVYDGDDTYMSGKYRIGGRYIHDWKNGGWGRISFNQAVQRSSNVGFVILAQKYLGFDRLYDYLMKFDFKEKTGIALPNEKNSNFQYTYPSEKATTAFGQGTAVTVMQMMKAATAVANDGKMMKPYIIDKVVNPNTDEVVMKSNSKVEGTPISAESAQKVRDLLRTVITAEHGTGTEFAIEGYKVAGKTGTAQIVGPDGFYMTDGYIHSFMGMAPKDDPQLLMYVAVDRPDVKYSVLGSKPVADIFQFVMKHSLQYLNIDPEEGHQDVSDDLSIQLDSYEGNAVSDAKETLKSQGMDVIVVGSGSSVTSQVPFAGDTILPGEKVLLRTGGEMKMPDLSGWSLAEVMKLARLCNLDPEVKGAGYVVDQSIAPGKSFKEGETLKVQLKIPKSADTVKQKDNDK